jgi:hypothetical protein
MAKVLANPGQLKNCLRVKKPAGYVVRRAFALDKIARLNSLFPGVLDLAEDRQF